MTVLFRRTFSKANAQVPFYTDASEFAQHMADVYVDAGECLSWRNVVVNNATTRVTESVWASLAEMNAALADPELVNNNILTQQYCAANSITSVTETEIS